MRGLLNARLYPHKVKVTRGRLNVKQIVYVVGYIGFMVFACNLMLAPVNAKQLPSFPTLDFVSTASFILTETALPLVTPTVTPSPIPTFTNTPVPFPASSPFPTLSVSINTNEPVLLTYNLSFYDPHIGYYFPEIAGVNCLEFDYELRDCVSKVHHGLDDYRMWLGKGAACPASLPYDAVFLVHEPKELVGYWRCIDTGDLDRPPYHYIDFMLTYPDMVWTGSNINDFPWSSPVLIELVSVP